MSSAELASQQHREVIGRKDLNHRPKSRIRQTLTIYNLVVLSLVELRYQAEFTQQMADRSLRAGASQLAEVTPQIAQIYASWKI